MPTRTAFRSHAVLVAGAAFALMLGLGARDTHAQGRERGFEPIQARHLGTSRAGAASTPRSEGDQAVVEGWPLYRTERGQAAFNDAMATLQATDGKAPAAATFRGCSNLACGLALPEIDATGWLASGRLWLSPSEYVLFVQSPRNRPGQSYRRRPPRSMRVFVFHEFHNSSRNVDVFDTISSHRSAVFVPLYMSKQATDAQGRRFVTIVQVAPYDVVSIHATNHGSAGPGIEVAKNFGDALEPLQEKAGVIVASIIKAAAPGLRVVNHRGAEGQPMLQAYEMRQRDLRARPDAPAIKLPFTAASPARIASAAGALSELLARRSSSPPIAVAERGILGGRLRHASLEPTSGGAARLSADTPALVEPVRLARPPRRPTQSTLVNVPQGP